MIRTALTIAGSDSGGGAGIQADLKTFADHGVYGASVITAITAQNSREVKRVDPVPVGGVLAQLEAVFDDLEVHAVKIGMLGSAEHVTAVAAFLAELEPRPPIVVDPVMIASTGARLLEPAAEDAIRTVLLPLARVITPNLDEAAVLARTDDREAIVGWARGLPCATLLTGGDVEGEVIEDLLVFEGLPTSRWEHAKRGRLPFHGTGCTMSAAIAAGLARKKELLVAVDLAVAYVQDRIADADERGSVGRGNPALIHGRGRHSGWTGG